MELNEAIKIFNYEKCGTKEEQLEAATLVFKHLFKVDVQNDDGSYKNMYNIIEEASKSINQTT